MYDVFSYGRMFADRLRMEAHERALRRAVEPGSIVVDLGAGTGIFALMACRMGAERVYAIETNSAIEVARQSAIDNGLADRIEFIGKDSRKVELPERADVLIMDLRGGIPWTASNLTCAIDARRRFLVDGGIMIPKKDTVWASVAQAKALYAELTSPWEKRPLDLDLTAGLLPVTSSLQAAKLSADYLLTEPRIVTTLDYWAVASPNLASELSWGVEREGVGHGLLLWFDVELAEGIGYTTAPGTPRIAYSNIFFPWPEAVSLEPGDRVAVSVRADLVNDEFIWRWSTSVASPAGSRKADFRQTSLDRLAVSPEDLVKRTAGFTPRLSGKGHVDSFVLQAIDGETSLRDLARRVADRFPSEFETWEEALGYLGGLSVRYSE